MKIKMLLERVEYELLQGNLEEEITGICHDNRQVAEGDAFLCIAGARFDTHNCIDEIAAKGAALIVVEKEVSTQADVTIVKVESTRKIASILASAFYGYPAEKMVTVGITGSKGKTTTTHMLADMLRAQGFETGTIGSNGAIFGDNLFDLDNSTPDPMEIQKYLAMMVKQGCTHAVIEVSSQGMKQYRVEGIPFEYGIWTNISEGDHIGGVEHKDFAEYLYCKAMLVQQSKHGFVFRDDPHTDALMAHITKPVTFFGYGDNADCVICDVEKIYEKDEPGFRFSIRGEVQGDYVLKSMPGLFNVSNAAAAICVAQKLGVSNEAVNQALGHLHIRGRFDMVYRGENFSVCVDFSHNGYSTRNHLKALREYHPKRIVCVFGADGNRSKSRRYEMGEASGSLADLSIVTSGHNRYETFEQILADIHVGLDKTDGAYIVIPERKKAIRYAIEHAEKGDLITILGLGHEHYQEENGVKYPYSDIDFVKETIKELGL
ncbi:MAG: UDP-N-acetylmuramoyl-L-alanyl-D-glutamate--2,6-diaminopimelate ligase [Lachnospiraceae bacterium]